MADHDAPISGIGVFGSLYGLGQCADLIDLQEKGIAALEFNGLLDALRIRDGQIVTIIIIKSAFMDAVEVLECLPDNLKVARLVEVAPSLPVVLRKGILDADNWVLLRQILVHVGELLVSDPF